MAEENRRYPLNLQGILGFCTENTKSEDGTHASAFQPMSTEEKQWLEKAVTGLQGTDPIQRIKQLIEIIGQNLYEVTDETESALEELIDWCENLDIACDFLKVGGRELVCQLLASPDSCVRRHGADLVAALCQNNPFCQNLLLSNGLLPVLSAIVDSSAEEDQVKVKAQYALSCLIRSNPDAQKLFVSGGGLSLLMRAMQSHVDKLRTKAAFLMLELVPENKDELYNMGAVEQLATMLRSEHDAFHEYLMAALLQLVESHAGAQTDARRQQLGIADLLRERTSVLQGKEEFEEELSYVNQLYSKLFGDLSQADADVEDR